MYYYFNIFNNISNIFLIIIYYFLAWLRGLLVEIVSFSFWSPFHNHLKCIQNSWCSFHPVPSLLYFLTWLFVLPWKSLTTRSNCCSLPATTTAAASVVDGCGSSASCFIAGRLIWRPSMSMSTSMLCLPPPALLGIPRLELESRLRNACQLFAPIVRSSWLNIALYTPPPSQPLPWVLSPKANYSERKAKDLAKKMKKKGLLKRH